MRQSPDVAHCSTWAFLQHSPLPVLFAHVEKTLPFVHWEPCLSPPSSAATCRLTHRLESGLYPGSLCRVRHHHRLARPATEHPIHIVMNFPPSSAYTT
eukprot:102943-Pyramimonas_sp.AAC.1